MMPHPLLDLWEEVATVVPYPDGVVEVPKPIEGTAFFPGGLGLWIDKGVQPPPMPTGKIMVLGQDFDTFASYVKAYTRGTEVAKGNATWRNLTRILENAHIPLTDCFFTNVWMGLRKDGKSTGPFPGKHDERFAQRCADFFKRQLEVQDPRLILVLGKEPLAFLNRHTILSRAKIVG